MGTRAILALLDAKPGKEGELERFLTSALPLARAERRKSCSRRRR